MNKDEEGNYLLKHNEFIKILSVEQDRNQIVNKFEIDETRDTIQQFINFVYQDYIPKNTHDRIFYESNRLRDASIISLIADSGLRISEIRMLNFNNIDITKNQISINRRRQRGRDQYLCQIKFGTLTKSIIDEYMSIEFGNESIDSPFFRTKGRNSNGTRITRRALELIIEKYANAYGKSMITANRIRQTFVLNFLESSKISTEKYN